MPFLFPPMPNSNFDVKKWFTNTFKKNQITGQTIGYKFNYDDHLNLFLHANFIVGETDVKVLNTFGDSISVIPISVYKKFVSRGQWDDSSYTKNERKLAWKIECLSNILTNKPDGITTTLSINQIEPDSEFDFGFYHYNENDDDTEQVVECDNIFTRENKISTNHLTF